jgi:hypothetical protein
MVRAKKIKKSIMQIEWDRRNMAEIGGISKWLVKRFEEVV